MQIRSFVSVVSTQCKPFACYTERGLPLSWRWMISNHVHVRLNELPDLAVGADSANDNFRQIHENNHPLLNQSDRARSILSKQYLNLHGTRYFKYPQIMKHIDTSRCHKLIFEATRNNDKQRWTCLNSSFNTELTIN